MKTRTQSRTRPLAQQILRCARLIPDSIPFRLSKQQINPKWRRAMIRELPAEYYDAFDTWIEHAEERARQLDAEVVLPRRRQMRRPTYLYIIAKRSGEKTPVVPAACRILGIALS